MRPIFTWLGVYFVRWMEALGRHPSLIQDPGLHAWQYLQRCPRDRAGPPGRRPPGKLVDDPHLSIGLSG